MEMLPWDCALSDYRPQGGMLIPMTGEASLGAARRTQGLLRRTRQDAEPRVPAMRFGAWLQRAPLRGFFALTFAWSWACWALSPVVRPQLPWLATAADVCRQLRAQTWQRSWWWVSTRMLEGLRAWLSRCLQWRIGWGWWALALLLPLAVIWLAAVLHVALGGYIAPAPVSGHLLMAMCEPAAGSAARWSSGRRIRLAGLCHCPTCSTGWDG